MTLVAEHNGTFARIREDRPDVGCCLCISFPSGESRDHLQDTKEIAILQAEEDYGVPGSAWQITEEIHVHLKDEGTDVWRPVDAIGLNEGIYQIPSGTRVPDDENWEFLPGTIVRCVTKELSDGVRLVAIEAQEKTVTEQINGGNGRQRA